jgi:putative RecB family exonuclease
MNLQEIHKLFEKYWKETAEHTDQIKYSKKNSFESLLDQGKQMLRTYVSKVPEDEYEVIAVEEPFEFKIEAGYTHDRNHGLGGTG